MVVGMSREGGRYSLGNMIDSLFCRMSTRPMTRLARVFPNFSATIGLTLDRVEWKECTGDSPSSLHFTEITDFGEDEQRRVGHAVLESADEDLVANTMEMVGTVWSLAV